MPHRRSTSHVRARTAALAVTAVLLAVGGCGPDDDAGAAAGRPSVVAPGRPGESARTLSAEEAARSVRHDRPGTADFGYVHRMIEHHRQALVMTRLAPDRAHSGKVERLAERIAAAQGPEIGAMEGWLATHGSGRKTSGHQGHGSSGADGKSHQGHGAGGHAGAGHRAPSGRAGHSHGPGDHVGMPGMASERQLAALRAARGRAFDALFLRLMITHHQGAVTMATELLSQGSDVLVEEMANDVIAQQSSEINRMRDMARTR
ncbi:DUF305 domain-containing protein [Streptomyces sp. bgisy100]|uniref:DUF305 domain-containing protein n=1 Tax=Streptomyces sp. bgisy100 TaxID=3413783 RepID=UPI003D716E53